MRWQVYILYCADGTLYTGITTDVERRLQEHNRNDKKGARYTRARRPVSLAFVENQPDRSSASKREAAIKKLNRKEKQALIQSYSCK